jgi:hypothetical protein
VVDVWLRLGSESAQPFAATGFESPDLLVLFGLLASEEDEDEDEDEELEPESPEVAFSPPPDDLSLDEAFSFDDFSAAAAAVSRWRLRVP